MATIALDTCYNEDTETIESVIADFSASLGIAGKVVDPHGPAGGWPVVEWEGTNEALTALVRAHYAESDDETDADLLERFPEFA